MVVPPTWTIHAERSYDAIGYGGDLPSNADYGCIDPPPFGTQCTLPRAAAIVACMAMQGCVAITCPDPKESHIGTRGITGPVCQLRTRRTPNERSHGMCRPGGCINLGLSRIGRPPALHIWQRLGLPSNASLTNAALVLFSATDDKLHETLLPSGLDRYWQLQRGDTGSPSTGLLFAVDAIPLAIGAAAAAPHGRRQYRRHDLWIAERGGGAGRPLTRPHAKSGSEASTQHQHSDSRLGGICRVAPHLGRCARRRAMREV